MPNVPNPALNDPNDDSNSDLGWPFARGNRPRWASVEASDAYVWPSRTTEIRSLDESFSPVGLLLRQVKVVAGPPHILISSRHGDIPITINQAIAVRHTLGQLIRQAQR